MGITSSICFWCCSTICRRVRFAPPYYRPVRLRLDLWRRRLFNGWLGLLVLAIDVVFVLQINSVLGQRSEAI